MNNPDSLAAIAALAQVRTCWLVRDWTPEVAAQARAIPLSETSISAAVLSLELVQGVKATGLGCRAWGIRDEGLMERAIAAGVDGMTIDFPDVLLRRLGR